MSARTDSLMSEAPGPSADDFDGFHYARVAQARAREAALCRSELPAEARVLLL